LSHVMGGLHIDWVVSCRRTGKYENVSFHFLHLFASICYIFRAAVASPHRLICNHVDRVMSNVASV
jgi:hypothetical protein